MVFARIALLAFLTAYGYSMGQLAPHELNSFGSFVAGLFFVAAPALYLLPTYEAYRGGHHALTSISMLNILAGWTVVGWVAALVWALNRKPASLPIPAPVTVAEPPRRAPPPATKKCPYCAEEVLAAAIKCKHCGSDISTPAA